VIQRDGSVMTYDSGDYPESQRRALEAAGWSDFPARQEAARKQGRYIGLGLCNYVEGTGRGPFESASVRIGASGKVVVTTGATAQGQGITTMLAQLAAGVLGIDPEDIHVIDGDTAASPLGLGAFASRQAVNAGNAVHRAAMQVAEKAKQVAAVMLEASPDDLELVDGMVRVKGVPGLAKPLRHIADALSGKPGFALPGGLPPGLFSAIDHQPEAMTFTSGTHVCEVEVDIGTGHVALTRYVVVHDCGNMINPLMVEGQVMGGVVHATRTASRSSATTPTTCCRASTPCRASKSTTWNRPPRSIRSASRARRKAAPSARRPRSSRPSRMPCANSGCASPTCR
jgi:carbon-monoxide dehydrogenase large subunit